jgi:uncharacterized membrane protein HdeD (DUF308 family)
MMKMLNRSNLGIANDACLSELFPCSFGILRSGMTESVANKLRWSSTFEQRLDGGWIRVSLNAILAETILLISTVLHKEISRSSIVAIVICGTTTFLAGILPIITYFAQQGPLNIAESLGIVGAIVGVFLARYRSRRSKVHWKTTLLETVAIVTIAIVVSLLVSGSA